MAVAAVLVVMALVGLRIRHRRVGLEETIAGIDELTRVFAAWELQHRPRRRALERQMSEIETAVARAEDSSHRSSTYVRSAHLDLLRRMEEVEHTTELQVLVTQGRIPSEHLS